MKKLSAKEFKPITTKRYKRKVTKTYERKYNVTDIATDEEAYENKCDCIIHSGGRQPLRQEGYMNIWYGD